MNPVWLEYVVPPEASWTPSSPGPSVLETSVSVSRISGVQYDQYGPEELCLQCTLSFKFRVHPMSRTDSRSSLSMCYDHTAGQVTNSVVTVRQRSHSSSPVTSF